MSSTLPGASASATSSAPTLWPMPGITLLASGTGRAMRSPATGTRPEGCAAPIWRLPGSVGNIRSRSSSLARITVMRANEEDLLRIFPTDPGNLQIGAAQPSGLVPVAGDLIALPVPLASNVIPGIGQSVGAEDVALADAPGKVLDMVEQ